MKLQRKIQRSMNGIIVLALVVSYIITTVVVYKQSLNILSEEIKLEAQYMVSALEISGQEYLDDLDAVKRETRVTLIDEDGQVLYDFNPQALAENHKRRPEVISALKNGEGEDVRRSATTGEYLLYYAKRLPDGSVFRVARSVDSVFATSLKILPWITALLLLLIFIAWRVSKWQADRIVRPINRLNLSRPERRGIYAELTPFLTNIEEHNREKDAVARMRQEFTANVSHELKTPLTSISGYAEIMKDGMVEPADVPDFSARIYHEANRLIALVDDVIKLSRLDEEVEMEREEIDLFDLTREVVDRLADAAAARQVHVAMSGEPVLYRGIPKVLEEMVSNLVENAIKYNQANGRVDIWVGNTLNGRKIIVSDTGIGIPREDQERIFERFYRVDKSHSKGVDGTGLGLSIVKHGVIIHGARLNLESEPGQGTKIEISF